MLLTGREKALMTVLEIKFEYDFQVYFAFFWCVFEDSHVKNHTHSKK